MLVTDDALLAGRDLVGLCAAAARGGITSVELRLKHAAPRDLLACARDLIAALSIPVLVNDRLDVALAAGAAGVHLGSDDLPVELARRVAPRGFIIGASVADAVEAGRGMGADYWGVGPWRASDTKPAAGPPLGEDGFRGIARLAGAIPCLAIGGVRPEDVALVRECGGAGVAVASGILGDQDVEGAARRYAIG